MKKCVLCYNRGQKCTIKLIVSIASLRKHYSGDIILCHEGEPSEYISKRVEKYGVEIRLTDKSNVRNALADKPSLYKYVQDYDVVLYVDSDTLFLQKIDEIWPIINRYGFVVTNFCNWVTKGGMIQRRIQEWSKVLPEKEINRAIGYGRAVNTGVFGFSNNYCLSDNNIFLEWHDLTVQGQKENCTRRMVDELACQVLLHKYPHIMLSEVWNASAKFYREKIEYVKIAHYHGYKHVFEFPLCAHWKKQYWELVKSKVIGVSDVFGDRRLRDWPQRNGAAWEVV